MISKHCYIKGYQSTTLLFANIEIEDDSASVLKHNHPHSFLFNGDLRDCHTVAKADVAFVTLDCSEHSVIGDFDQGYFNNLVLGTYKILKSSQARMLFFENVPAFYNSFSYKDLQEMLLHDYPFSVGPIQLESFDFGSIALRNRSYAVYFQEKEDFDLFRIPKPPVVRHKKLKEFLDSSSTIHVWKSVEKWMESFSKKSEKNNAWADRNTDKTFVDENAIQLQCIPSRYRSHSASNSYVLNKDHTQWRFLTVSELRRIFSIPSWFEWPKHIPVTRVYEQIGQSVCGRVIKAFGNELASIFFRRVAEERAKARSTDVDCSFLMDQSGQIGFSF